MTNDKLPEEIRDQIKQGTESYEKYSSHMAAHIGYRAGATAWAPWKVRHDKLQAQAQRIADALEMIAEDSCDYDSVDFAVTSHSPNCRACKARELVQQFRDGKGKEVDKKPVTSEVFNPEQTIICAECKIRPALTDYNGHGFYVCKSCDDTLNREFDNEYK